MKLVKNEQLLFFAMICLPEEFAGKIMKATATNKDGEIEREYVFGVDGSMVYLKIFRSSNTWQEFSFLYKAGFLVGYVTNDRELYKYILDDKCRPEKRLDFEDNTVAEYSYPESGKKICKESGGETTILYDENFRILETIDPSGNSRICSYKKNGLLKSVSGKDGISLIFEYFNPEGGIVS